MLFQKRDSGEDKKEEGRKREDDAIVDEQAQQGCRHSAIEGFFSDHGAGNALQDAPGSNLCEDEAEKEQGGKDIQGAGHQGGPEYGFHGKAGFGWHNPNVQILFCTGV
jgi:hypothetical protein